MYSNYFLIIALLSLGLCTTIPNFKRPSPSPSVLANTFTSTLTTSSSTVNRRLYESGIASLYLTQDSGTNQTTATLQMPFVDHGNGQAGYSHTFNGIWNFVGLQDSYTCNIIQESTSNAYSTLQFTESTSSWSVTELTLPSLITSPSTQTVMVSSDCQALYFRQGDVTDYYYVKTSSTTYAFHRFTNAATVATSDFRTVHRSSGEYLYIYDSSSQVYNTVQFEGNDFDSEDVYPQTVQLYQVDSRYIILEITGFANTSISFLSTLSADSYVGQTLSVRRKIGVMNSLGTQVQAFTDQGFQYVDGGSMKTAVSPDLTKIITVFRTTDFNASSGSSNSSSNTTTSLSPNTLYIKARTIDYDLSVSQEILFTDETQIQNTLNQSVENVKLTVTNRFLIVSNPTSQDVYRFRGVYAIYMGSSTLPNNFNNNTLAEALVKLVDDYLTVVLVGIFNSNSYSYNLAGYSYGLVPLQVQLDSNEANVVLTQAIPYTTLRQYFSPSYEMLWVYSQMNVVSTNTTIIYLNPAANNSNSTSFVHLLAATGNWQVESIEAACGVFSNINDATQFRVVIIQNSNYASPLILNISTLIAAFSPTDTSVWVVSRDCTGFRMDRFVFKVDLTSNTILSNAAIAGNTQWTAIDEYLNYVLLPNGTILHYNTANKAFQNFASLSSVATNSTLHSWSDRLIFIGVQSTSLRLLVYNRVNNNAVLVLDSSFSSATTPIAKVSLQKTKILVFRTQQVNGVNTNTNQVVSIDYSATTNNFISLSSHLVTLSATDSYLFIDQNYIYTHTYSSASSQMEYLYWFKYTDKAVLIYQEEVTSTEQSTWIKTILVDNPATNSVALYKQYNVSSSLVLRQVDVGQIQENQYYEKQGVIVSFINNEAALCPYGCSSCEEGSCEACLSGFVLDGSSYICVECPANCDTCSVNDITDCSSCTAGTYRASGGACSSCSSPCLTCSDSSTNCTSCLPGYYSSGNTCIVCSSGCKTCSSSTCSECFPRFTLFNGNCLLCGPDCTGCSSTNILECTSCAAQFFLNGTTCSHCPQFCLTCSSSSYCQLCQQGYFSDLSGACTQQCSLPCATCSNSPSECASCYSGFTLSNSTCISSDTCSSSYSCYECAFLSNYYLSNIGQCLACPTIDNCLQCSESVTTECAVCIKGYYLSAGACVSCPVECVICQSSNVCRECNSGYTFVEGQTAGTCQKCHSSCQKCHQQVDYCLECAANFTSNGWFCQQGKTVRIEVVLNGQTSAVLTDLASISQRLKQLLANGDSTLLDDISLVILSVTSGSARVSANAVSSSSNDDNLNTAASNFNTQVSTSSSIGNYAVTSSTATAQGTTTTTTTTSSSDDDSNTTRIIVLAVVIPVVVIFIIVIVVLCYKKNKSEETNGQQPDIRASGESQKEFAKEQYGVQSDFNYAKKEYGRQSEYDYAKKEYAKEI